MSEFKDGIFDDIDIEKYHADRDYISASSIKQASKSLAHHRHYLDNPSERKSHFDFGNVFELALMDAMNDTDEFFKHSSVFDPERRPEPDKTMASKRNKEWKAKIFDTDKYIINKTGKESVETMELMLASCWKDKIIQRLLKSADYQKTLFWTDPTTGIKVKTRPDFCKINKRVLIDVKTTLDASPSKFAKDAANFNYPLQATIQIEGTIQSGLMEAVDLYYWIVVEKNPPYNAQVYEFKKDDREWSLNMYNLLLHKIKVAREEDKWLGYTEQAHNDFGILELELPVWYMG